MDKPKEMRRFLEKNGWLIAVLLAGLLLMNAGSGKEDKPFDTSTAEEQRLSNVLRRMEGVGETYVLLAEKPGRDQGYSGAVVVCRGGGDPAVKLRVTLAVQAFTSLGSDRIIVQKLIS